MLIATELVAIMQRRPNSFSNSQVERWSISHYWNSTLLSWRQPSIIVSLVSRSTRQPLTMFNRFRNWWSRDRGADARDAEGVPTGVLQKPRRDLVRRDPEGHEGFFKVFFCFRTFLSGARSGKTPARGSKRFTSTPWSRDAGSASRLQT